MKNGNPCQNCYRRVPECPKNCDDFKAWKKLRAREAKEMRERMKANFSAPQN